MSLNAATMKLAKRRKSFTESHADEYAALDAATAKLDELRKNPVAGGREFIGDGQAINGNMNALSPVAASNLATSVTNAAGRGPATAGVGYGAGPMGMSPGGPMGGGPGGPGGPGGGPGGP